MIQILAAAAIHYLASDSDVNEALTYYNWRLLRAFLQHARACDGFYRGAFSADPWRQEIQRGEQPILALSAALHRLPNVPAFRLQGMALSRVASHPIG